VSNLPPAEMRDAEQPLLTYRVTGPYMLESMREQIDLRVIPPLQGVDGIAGVDASGGARRMIRIDLNPEKILAYGVTPEMVVSAVRGLQLVADMGMARRGSAELSVVIRQTIDSVPNISDLIITSNGTRSIRVSDVGSVHDTFEEATSYSRVNGFPALTFTVRQQARVNTVELANTAPTPNTVGVFPFLAVTDDPEMKALGTALAELLTTDLSQTDRLTVVERAQVQALLTEMSLGESGRVDPATASRSGRLLGAANLVQGRVETTGSDLSVQAMVVNVPGGQGATSPVREDDALSRIFDMEKRLALALYERMGIQLTQAERDRVTRTTTTNVQALLAFGFGLEAADAGRDIEAATHFVRALNLDPAFDLARTQWSKADQSIRAAGTSTNLLGRLGLAEAGSVSDWRTRFDAVEALMADPATRDPAAEVLGTEGSVRRGTAEIVIRRPTGGN
jgi:TolB-like protein